MHLIILFSIMLLTFACSSQPAGDKQSNNTRTEHQIIIGFTNSTTDPQDPSLISTIAIQLSVNLEFVHRISGNAAVYKVNSSQTQQQLLEKLQQLGQHDDIKYAEFNQRQTIQKITDK